MVQGTKIPMEITTNTVYLGEQPVGAVNSVNGKTGDVYLYADDIDFDDGQSFQEKLDAGLLKGEKGDKGDKGDTGSQGIQGEKGLDGAKGDKGDTGEQGLKGDTGQQGEQGLKGDKGEQGEQGLKGDKGDTGAQGIQGAKGADGKDGLTTQLTINTAKYTQVDGNIALPTVDMVVTAEDGTITTYKVVANV